MLTQVVLLCRIVLEQYESVTSDGDSPVYRALVLTSLSASKPVRAMALKEVKSLLADKSTAQVAKNLVAKLNEILEEGRIFNAKEKKDGAEEKGAEVTGKMLLDCVQAFCSCRGKLPSRSSGALQAVETYRSLRPAEYPPEDAQTLAVAALPASHHPLAAAVLRRAWLKVVAYLRLDAKKLVALYANSLNNTYITGFEPTQVRKTYKVR